MPAASITPRGRPVILASRSSRSWAKIICPSTRALHSPRPVHTMPTPVSTKAHTTRVVTWLLKVLVGIVALAEVTRLTILPTIRGIITPVAAPASCTAVTPVRASQWWRIRPAAARPDWRELATGSRFISAPVRGWARFGCPGRAPLPPGRRVPADAAGGGRHEPPRRRRH